MKQLQVLLVVFTLSPFFVGRVYSQNGITTTNTNDTNIIKNALAGPGVVITKVVVNCPNSSLGIFGNATSTNLGLDSGLILTTGTISDLSKNGSSFTSVGTGSPGDPDLSGIAGSSVYDGCKVEFDITPYCDSLQIKYVYGSEEYPEYVNSGFNDAFAFFVSGANPAGGNYVKQNIALTPGTGNDVTINTINGSTNSNLYIDNNGNSNSSSIVYDGFTIPLLAKISVVPCSTYHMILTISDAGDAAYDSGVMFQYQGFTCPNPPIITASNDTTICPGQSITLTVTGNPSNTYQWSQVGIYGTISTNNQLTITPNDTTVTYKVETGPNTCMQPDFVTVSHFDTAKAVISANTLYGCGPLCTQLSYTTATTPVACFWNFGDGDSLAGCDINHCYTLPGLFDLKYTYIDINGCSATVTNPAYIEVYPVPIAGFTTNETDLTFLQSQLIVTDNSQNAEHWHYDITYQENLLTDTMPSLVEWLDLDQPDSVYITQIVTTDKGCSDTITDAVYVKSDFAVYYPNAFSPNGDLKNDKFTIYVIGAKSYTFRVYDRWGDVIYRYEQDGIDAFEFTINWDGHANSGERPAQQDVYVWKLNLRDKQNKEHDYKSHVTLLK